jgi:hypothetical protein
MNVARMDRVEATIGEPDLQIVPEPLGDLPQRRSARHDFFTAAGQSAAPKFLFQIAAADHGRPVGLRGPGLQ